MRKIQLLISVCLLSFVLHAQKPAVWSKERSNSWYQQLGWVAGSNFLPSTAINQLEMWQKETFDTATINRELGWAENIGMHTMRVFLHDLVWKEDPKGFKQRINTFLAIASHHHIKTLFVFFDDCWNEEPKSGKQPEPKPGVHNSGWMRSPAMSVHNDSTQWSYLEQYVKDILRTFKNDNRIWMWDLYNEPGNSGYGMGSFPLLKRIFSWAWEIRPSQPISAGVWFTQHPQLNKFQLENSDVITFHNYDDTVRLKKAIDTLRNYGKSIICTEYMARTNNSNFLNNMPVLERYGVAAINWGFVSGKSNTIFPWGSKEGSTEPAIWFHDIFRKDGTPFSKDEIILIKKMTQDN